jgi:hypothetical protein
VKRFDNISTEDLTQQEHDLRTEACLMKLEVQRRMLADCPAKCGWVYPIIDGRFKGRYIMVSQVIVEYKDRWETQGKTKKPCGFVCTIHGVLRGTSTRRDGFNINHIVLWNSTLDYTKGVKGPRDYNQYHHTSGNEDDE